jgi:hypothetical protein
MVFPLLAESRSWTDKDGRKVVADYVSHDESEVVMRLTGGREARVPLNRLCLADREFLQSLVTEGETSASATDIRLNWDSLWPDRIELEDEVEIKVVREDAERNEFVYESDHYRFTCDARLATSVVSNFAEMFEATRAYCSALPLGIAGAETHEGRFDIRLFEHIEAYRKAGGPPNSAGVYVGGKNLVMVPLTSLGVRKVGSGFMRDRDKDDSTLVHELTHQLSPRCYFRAGSRGWFSEGIAEYCGRTPYSYGRFHVRNNIDDLIEYATAYGKENTGGRALGEEFRAPRLREFMTMPYSQFTGSKANFNYGFGLLLTIYFLHFDGEGDASRMKEFLKALHHSNYGTEPDVLFAKLLDGRTWAELEEEVAKSWRRKGVKIEFPEDA